MKSHEALINFKLQDKQLRTNLQSAMRTLQTNRKNLINSKYIKWEELREKGKSVKENALMSLDERVEEFEKNARKNGIKVHFAQNSQEANEIVLEIAKKNGADRILKGKSMASEETHLNSFMEEHGLKAVETDLGELIIQLIDEPPVHIVAPAIHKNRYEIGEIFASKLGVAKESEPEKLNEIARKYLREEFKQLKVGVTGVNFAISQAGAIWLLENEGNGRMCSTYPDIHIAICGIEKIVASFEDAITLNTLLVPSATGQPITCYNNIITSPRKEGEKDGPKELHVILLDNNRTKMLAHEEYHEALRCIRCGACMNYCPVYDKIGGHAYRAVYPGPIGAVISPQIFGMDKYADILSLCSLCGRCSEVCPVKIPLAENIRRLRRDRVGEGKNPPLGAKKLELDRFERVSFQGFAKLATHSFLFYGGIKIASYLNSLLQSIAKHLPLIKQWTKYHEMPKFQGDLHKKVQELEGVIYE